MDGADDVRVRVDRRGPLQGGVTAADLAGWLAALLDQLAGDPPVAALRLADVHEAGVDRALGDGATLVDLLHRGERGGAVALRVGMVDLPTVVRRLR